MAKKLKKTVVAKPASAEDAAQSAQRLTELRHKIDELDRQLVEVLNARANVVVEVGKLKQAGGKPIYAPDREHVVLSRVAKLNHGPLPQRTLAAIYREMMSGSFALERPQRIGYLGPQGSFSNMAAQKKFGSSVEYRPLTDIRAVFEEVARGHCDLGIVPIENSAGGGVIDTMDSFVGAHVYVCGEVILEVHQNLLANCPAGRIKSVASKPEVFAQCRNWLSTSFHQADLLPVASTSKAAEMAASSRSVAAIGSTLAAELYGLKVIFANIEDTPNNMTRFFVISTSPARRTGADKTSIMFTTAHRAGALVSVLNVFAKNGVNLTNIATRPSKRRNWEYYFFVDAEGHSEDENVAKALSAARDHCGELHVLGSYPKASEPV